MSLNVGVISGVVISGAAVSGLLGLSLVPILKKYLLPHPKTNSLSDSLQIESLCSDGLTIKGKDGSLTRILEVGGLDLNNKTEAEQTQILKRRQMWLDSLAKEGASFKIISVRNKITKVVEPSYSLEMLSKINEAWNQDFKEIYTTKHYLCITEDPKKLSASSLFSLEKSLASIAKINDLVHQTFDILHDFSVRDLDINKRYESELLTFIASLINGEETKIKPSQNLLAEKLASKKIVFDNLNGIVTFVSGTNKQYASIISLKEWGDESSANLLNDILSLPLKITVLHVLNGFKKQHAKEKLETKEKQTNLIMESQNVSDEFDIAKNLIAEEASSYYAYQLSFIVYEETIEKLKLAKSILKSQMHNHGVAPIVESFATEWIWRNQFPGTDVPVRNTYPMSHNLAHLITFNKDYKGFSNSDWGQGPIRTFKNLSGGLYEFQFHRSSNKSDLGHTIMVAPAGSGKTTFAQHLIGGALKFSNLKIFIFDRLSGTKIFTEALGGIYVDLTAKQVPLNPLVCDDTKENRQFIQKWLVMLSGIDHNDANEIQAVGRAIDIIFRLPKEKRILTDIFESTFDIDTQLREGLQKWVGEGPLAYWFNGKRLNNGIWEAYDAIDLEQAQLVSFDMKVILDNPIAAASITTYIMHKIRNTVRNLACPHLIFIDETGPQLKDPNFRNDVEVILNEHRKLRGVVILCFQNADSIRKSEIESAILNNCPTVILFPNSKAEWKDYEAFKLSDSEWNYVKGNNKMSKNLRYTVLVKKETTEGGNFESSFLNINFSGLGHLIKVYNSSSEAVSLAKDLKEKWGTKWLEKYLEF